MAGLNYLSQIHFLEKKNNEYRFNCYEHRLYHYLLFRCNGLMWKNPFTDTNGFIASSCKFSITTLKTARKRLQEVGLIEVTSGGSGPMDYTQYYLLEAPDNKKVSPHDTIINNKVSPHDTLDPIKVSPHDSIENIEVSAGDTLEPVKVSPHDTLRYVEVEIAKVSPHDTLVEGNKNNIVKGACGDTLPEGIVTAFPYPSINERNNKNLKKNENPDEEEVSKANTAAIAAVNGEKNSVNGGEKKMMKM